MKKLKCESCGANLKIDQNDKNIAYCEYCGAKYKLNEELKIDIRLDDDIKESLKMGQNIFKEFNPKRQFTVFVVGALSFIIIIATIGIVVKRFNEREVIEDYTEEKIDETSDWIKKKGFNSKFESYVGTIRAARVKWLFDDVSTNNKTNKRKITIKYREVNTSDSDEIVNLKSSIKKEQYEVILDYDDDGYVYQIRVKETE